MNTTEATKYSTLETDIVVVGGGGAGLAAAVAGAEKGAKVILVEKGALGGNTALARGILAVESHLQKQLNLSITKDEAFKIAMEYSHWKINPRLLRAFLNKSADTLDWLEKMGLQFVRIETVYAGSLPTMHSMDVTKHGGADIVKALRQRCEELGVKIYPHCPTKKLLTDSNRKLCGVLVEMNNQECRINARGVVIATGGYGGNKDLLKKYYELYDEHAEYVGVPNTGDGLLMAMELGAATEGLGTVMVHHHFYKGAREVNMLIRDPAALWLNKKGERFADETISRRSVECGNVLDRQPDRCVYVIIDNAIKSRIEKEFEQRGRQSAGQAQGNNPTNMDDIWRTEMEKGGVMVASSWDEMAGWMGIAPQALEDAVSEYNSSCQNGYDEIFNKDPKYLAPLQSPPYYAVKCYMHYLTTMGGIKINHRTEVMNKQDDPIPGLYAAGDCAGGLEAGTYCMVLASSGLGFAVNSGRIAGENATDYIMSGKEK